MSSYRDYIEDFPTRCLDVLRTYESSPTDFVKRDVTLALMLASAAIVVPFERLIGDGVTKGESQSQARAPANGSLFSERPQLGEAIDVFEKLLGTSFVGSTVGPSSPTDDWRYSRAIPISEALKDPGDWMDQENRRVFDNGKPKRIEEGVTCKFVLGIVRNALSHGNIAVRPRDGEIAEIIFCETHKKSSHFNLIVAKPSAFVVFLKKWVDFLPRLRMPEGIGNQIDTLKAAA